MNSVNLTGRLTKDIELRKTTNGTSTTNFTLAVDRPYKPKDNEPSADFINCVAWKQGAEFLGNYAHKGSKVAVEGHIQTRSYEGQNGRVYVTEVVAERVELLDSKPQPQVPTHNYPEHSNSYDQFKNTQNIDISSDDLPFY